MVYFDASRVVLVYVLMINDNVIPYASKELKVHEYNFSTHDIELADVVFSLKICRYYLYGAHVCLFTNKKSLQYMFTYRELNLR